MKSDALTHEDRAKEFVAAVRDRLADLPSEEVDELLDGLQADLTDRLADGEELGDPAGYADELRQAAGFPARSETGGAKTRRTTARERWKRRAERTRTYWAATPQRRAVRDFMISLRPLWWVIRGLVLTWLLLAIFAHPNTHGVFLSFPAILIAVAAIVVSAQWGRGLWTPKRWLERLRKIANVVALVFLIPAFVTTYAGLATGNIAAVPDAYEGLTLGGEPIDNIFAYDCEGNPIDLVRLYDENGQPLTTTVDPGDFPVAAHWSAPQDENLFFVPNALAAEANAWNVFPLREARLPLSESYSKVLAGDMRAKDAKPPFTRATSLGVECPAPAAESTPDESAGSTPQE